MNILVTLLVSTSKTADSTITFAHHHVVVTDASGASQEQDFDGTETPTPFARQFSVADGKGTVVAQAIDTNGSPIGDSVEQDFDTTGSGTGGGGPGPGNEFPSLTGISVTPA